MMYDIIKNEILKEIKYRQKHNGHEFYHSEYFCGRIQTAVELDALTHDQTKALTDMITRDLLNFK